MNPFCPARRFYSGMLLLLALHPYPAELSLEAAAHTRQESAAAPAHALRTASGCPMQYYVSLPKGWTAARKWPVVVVLDGGAREWLATADTFASARGDFPFILVTPLILTEGGVTDNSRLPSYHYADSVWKRVEKTGPAAFDQEGLNAIAHDVARDFSGEEKYFLAGSSVGAHLVWMMVFMHPEALAGAASSCGDFNGSGISSYSDAKERVGLPVRGFVGALDGARFGPRGAKQNVRLIVPMPLVPREYGLQGAFEYAAKLAKVHGYRNVSLRVIPRRGRDLFARDVLAWFYSIRKR